MSTAGIIKVSTACPIFYGHGYPKWKAMMRKRLLAMDSELWTVMEIGLTDLCKMEHADDIQKYTLRLLYAPACPETSSGASCISAMRSLYGTGSLMFMKVIKHVRTPG